jgi:glycerol-3-phosphate acyltransferase PlsY
MFIVMRLVLAMIVGYLLGSIPSGVIVGRASGVDVHQSGSGKTGATNVLRSAGWGAGLIVATADALKGAIPVLLAHFLFAPVGHGVTATASAWIATAAGLAAVLGHTFPIYVGFKGGRGVATTGGMALALAWPAALLALVVFILPIVVTRYVSLGSIVGASLLPFVYLGLTGIIQRNPLTGADWATFAALFIAAIAIDVSHRDNIERILNGTERRLGEKATPTPSPV